MNRISSTTTILKGLLILLAACCFSLPVVGQASFVPPKKAVKNFEEAKSLFMENKLQDALVEIREVVERYPDYIEAWILLADISNKSDDPENEIFAWQQVLKIDASFFKNSHYFLAEAQLKTGDYQSALEQLDLFLQTNKISENLRSRGEKLRKQCIYAIEGIRHPLPFSPVRMEGINSEHDEYWPSIQTDGKIMVYTRQERLKDMGLGDEDFFFSKWSDSIWKAGEPIPGELNTAWNEGAQSISSDGKWMFFTACNRPDGKGQCDIYVSRKIKGKWLPARNLGSPVNTASWESNPSISADGKILYFATKRAEGKGKIDLYKAVLFGSETDGFPRFRKVENLGETINTPFDEMAPFIHPDGRTLFFTSNGHPGFGGADLFRSVLDPSGKWTEPENLGYPINTHKDEVGLVVDAPGKYAYFSSDRPGSEGRDIYRFELPEQLQPTPVTYAKGFITGNGKPLNATIQVRALKDSIRSYLIHSGDENGEFMVCLPVGEEYLFNTSAPNYLMHSMNLNLASVFTAEEPFLFNVELSPIKAGKSVVLENIFFLTDSYQLLPESEKELQSLIQFLQINPSVNIEIAGHTDNLGTAEYNLQLSEKRAREVFIYLAKHGVEEKRLSYKGYGFEFPLTTNKSESGRAKNRRTEFIVK